MTSAAAEKPWFGIEQEYTLFKSGEKVPLGFPDEGEPARPQGPLLQRQRSSLQEIGKCFDINSHFGV